MALPMQFPPSEIYHFEPLDEHVPVYQEPFQLVQELVTDATREASQAFFPPAPETASGTDSNAQPTLTVRGTLEYQACDDAICYNPQSIPLSWTVALRPYAASASR